MRVLAIDTTTRAGSLALMVDGRLVEEWQGDGGRTHGERLPGDLIALLERHGLTLADVDLFGLAAGPGSFTGLRIGIATIQGLAFATGRPVVPVSALEALARRTAALSRAPVLGVWMDAQRREVFASLWQRSEDTGAPSAPTLREEATVDAPADVLTRWLRQIEGPFALAGDGALAYRALVAPHAGRIELVETVPLLAGEIARLATERAQAGRTVGPSAIQPIYIRRPDAEIARDRGVGAGPGRAT